MPKWQNRDQYRECPVFSSAIRLPLSVLVAEYSRSALRLGENPQTKLLSAQTPALESFLALVSVADAVAFRLERPADCNPRCSETACGSLDQPESFLPRTHS